MTKKKILLIILGVIIVFSILSYLEFFKRKLFPSQTPSRESRQSIILAPTKEDITKDLEQRIIYFSTSADKAKYGDFVFQYPATLVLKKSEIVKVNDKNFHYVVLSRWDNDEEKIEINAPYKKCADYLICKEKEGFIIGTNSRDQRFLKWFEIVLNSFSLPKVEPPSNNIKK